MNWHAQWEVSIASSRCFWRHALYSFHPGGKVAKLQKLQRLQFLCHCIAFKLISTWLPYRQCRCKYNVMLCSSRICCSCSEQKRFLVFKVNTLFLFTIETLFVLKSKALALSKQHILLVQNQDIVLFQKQNLALSQNQDIVGLGTRPSSAFLLPVACTTVCWLGSWLCKAGLGPLSHLPIRMNHQS